MALGLVFVSVCSLKYIVHLDSQRICQSISQTFQSPVSPLSHSTQKHCLQMSSATNIVMFIIVIPTENNLPELLSKLASVSMS